MTDRAGQLALTAPALELGGADIDVLLGQGGDQPPVGQAGRSPGHVASLEPREVIQNTW